MAAPDLDTEGAADAATRLFPAPRATTSAPGASALRCPTTRGVMSGRPRVVEIGGALTTTDVADVAIGHASVRVDRTRILARLDAARAVVDATVLSGVPAYGVNRGLGPLRDHEIPAELMGDFQRYVILSHAAAIGKPLSRIESRAALLTRLNTLAAGASGASPALFEGLLELLLRDVIPVIPDQGSVGAADLSQLAAIGQVLIGAGEAWLPGRTRSPRGLPPSRRRDCARSSWRPRTPSPWWVRTRCRSRARRWPTAAPRWSRRGPTWWRRSPWRRSART